jgi:hypothetical protein
VKEAAVRFHRGLASASLGALTLGLGGAACSEDQSTPEAVESLQEASQDLRDIDILDEGIAGINGALLNVSSAVEDVAESCDAVRDPADDLVDGIRNVLRALGPSQEGETDAALTVAGVVPQLNAVLVDTDALLEDVSADC